MIVSEETTKINNTLTEHIMNFGGFQVRYAKQLNEILTNLFVDTTKKCCKKWYRAIFFVVEEDAQSAIARMKKVIEYENSWML